jgi:hypothetical protein
MSRNKIGNFPYMKTGTEIRKEISNIIKSSLSQEEATNRLYKHFEDSRTNLLEEISLFALNKTDKGWNRSFSYINGLRQKQKE